MFQVAEGKLPADYQVYYLPFSLMKLVEKFILLSNLGLHFYQNPKLPLICQSHGE
ncbi:MAG: hypothetical protein GYA35_08715 [Thermoanaerobaculaceae bacterium]|nr:hypothetical protein [Thermoanaerobaculaceae bacterium]